MYKTIGVTALIIATAALALPLTNSALGLIIVRGGGGGHAGIGHIGIGHIGVGHYYGGHYAGHAIIGHAYGHHFLYRGHTCYYILNQFNQYQLYCPGVGIVP